ncbi:MAG: hypothetical protein WKF58_04825 [Ilumatobacteraceae bacterium]
MSTVPGVVSGGVESVPGRLLLTVPLLPVDGVDGLVSSGGSVIVPGGMLLLAVPSELVGVVGVVGFDPRFSLDTLDT